MSFNLNTYIPCAAIIPFSLDVHLLTYFILMVCFFVAIVYL